MQLTKQSIQSAMAMSGFERWRPAVDVPDLHRPQYRPVELPGEGWFAAVMLLFYPTIGSNDQSQIHLVLTRRNRGLTKHAGQISLPGGRQNRGESLQTTALRETWEEIGVSADRIEILGKLNSTYIPPSDFTVSPFVGWHPSRPGFVRSECEVDEIIEVSLAHLLDPTTMVQGEVEIPDGSNLVVPYYKVNQHRVWGATALILGELIERVLRARRETD